MIPDNEKKAIQKDLDSYESQCHERLENLGLTVDELDQEGLLKYEKDGIRGHEIDAVRQTLLALELLQGDLMRGSISGIFRHAVLLGIAIPKGARHPYDEKMDFHETRKKAGGQRENLKKYNDEYKPFILKEAQQLLNKNPRQPLTGRNGVVPKVFDRFYETFDVEISESWILKEIRKANKDPNNSFTLPEKRLKRGRPKEKK